MPLSQEAPAKAQEHETRAHRLDVPRAALQMSRFPFAFQNENALFGNASGTELSDPMHADVFLGMIDQPPPPLPRSAPGGAVMKKRKKKLGVSNMPYDGGRWVTDGGWCVTDGGWWVTNGGWCVTDGGWWVATKHQRVDAIEKKKKKRVSVLMAPPVLPPPHPRIVLERQPDHTSSAWMLQPNHKMALQRIMGSKRPPSAQSFRGMLSCRLLSLQRSNLAPRFGGQSPMGLHVAPVMGLQWVSFSTPPHCRGQWAVGILPYTAALQGAAGSWSPAVHRRTAAGSGQ